MYETSITGGMKIVNTFGQHFQVNVQFKNSKQKVMTLLHLGGLFATCLVIVASNAIVLLSAKHFELAPNFHFLPLFLFKIELPTALELPCIALFIYKYPNNGINLLL
jgi:hypothetical protein